jgi:hypothetical protein
MGSLINEQWTADSIRIIKILEANSAMTIFYMNTIYGLRSSKKNQSLTTGIILSKKICL